MVDRVRQELGQDGEDRLFVLGQVLNVGQGSHERGEGVQAMQRLGFKGELNMPIARGGITIDPRRTYIGARWRDDRVADQLDERDIVVCRFPSTKASDFVDHACTQLGRALLDEM